MKNRYGLWLVVVILISLSVMVKAENKPSFIIEHQEGSWRQNLRYYIYHDTQGIRVDLYGPLNTLLHLEGDAILGYNLESASQLKFTKAVLGTSSWEGLENALKYNIEDGQALVFTEGGQEGLTYTAYQVRALNWNIQEKVLIPLRIIVPTATRSAGAAGDIASTSPAISGENIRLLTFNIRFGCGNGRECTDINTNVNNIITVINDLDPDVVALQETQGNGGNPLVALKQQLANYIFYEEENQALLIKNSHHLQNGPVRHNYAQGSRYYLRSEVILKGIPFVIFQTHLTRSPFRDVSASCQLQSQEKDDSVTLSQAAELANAISGEETDKPIILLGDLNIEANQINNVAEMLTEATRNVGATFPTQEYCDSRDQYGLFNQQEKIDYIFASSNVHVVQARRYESLPEASDHYPVYADVQFAESYTPAATVTVPERSATPLGESYDTLPPAASSSGETTVTTVTRNCIACQQIDDVWEKVRVALNIVQAGLTRPVWNPETSTWVEHTVLYAPPVQIQPRAQPRVTGTATLDLVKEIRAVNIQTTEEQCFNSHYGSGNTVQLESVTVAGKTLAVNRAMALPLSNVARVIENYGYEVKAIGSCRQEGNTAANCGNFHLACLAVDINPSQNPHCPKVANWESWWGYTPMNEERERCRRGEIITNIPPEIVKAFEENGFYWGGRYGQQYDKPTPDPMHFEFVDGTAKCCERKYSPLSYTYTGQQPAVAAVSAIPGVAREDQFDQHIAQAASKFGVDAALIKALIQKESGFNSNAPRGGLMQVRNFDHHYTNMVRTYSDLASLSHNVTDPRTNIFVGAYVFDQTRKLLRGCTDLGCQIAAYNVGQGVINAAAVDAFSPPTWDKVSTVLNVGHFKKFETYQSWTNEQVQDRVNRVKNYVRTVLSYREQYVDRV